LLIVLAALTTVGVPALGAEKASTDSAHCWYRPPAEFDSVKYVIITSHKLTGAFDPLALWKTRKGIATDIVFVEDILANPLYRGTDSAETIRNFIADLYWKWGLDYVMLGGDVNLVPTRMIPYGNGASQASDLYFSALDGTWNANCDSRYGDDDDRVDHIEDVYVGRVPAETAAEVKVFLKKFFLYIKPLHRDYQKKILLLGAVLGDDFRWDADDHYREIKDDFLRPAGFQIIELEESSTYRGTVEGVEVERERNGKKEKVKRQTAYIFGESNGRQGPCNLKNMTKYVNEGVGFVSHIIHSNVYLMGLGEGWLDQSAVKKLTNAERPFVVYSSGCQVNMFNQESISEHVFFHPGGGAVAFIGCTVNSYAYQNMFERDFWECLFFHGIHQIGPLLAACKARQNYKVSAPSNPITIIVRGLNLLGDPEMPVWSDTPADLSISHPTSCAIAQGKFLVTVANQSTAKPVQNALVCLWKEGEVFVVAKTGRDGRVEIEAAPRTPGRILVTVTAPNYVPYEGEAQVKAAAGQAARGIVLADFAVDDAEKGNGNHRLEAGETARVLLAFQNTSSAALPMLKITVKDAGKHLKVVTDTTALVGLNPGAFAITPKPIVVTAGSQTPKNQKAVLRLAMKAGGASWEEEVVLWLNTPWVVHAGHRIDDSATDGDGILTEEDAGKTVKFLVDISNLGTGSARGLAVELRLQGDDLRVKNSTIMVKELPVGARLKLEPFRIALGPGFSGDVIEATLTYADASGLSRTDEFTLEDPRQPPAAFRAQSGAESVRLFWEVDEEEEEAPERVAGYNVYRACGSEKDFKLISPTPVPSSCFEDVGLALLNLYRYRVTTVDRSLNESRPSKEVAIWTSYAYQRDWPQSARGRVRQAAVHDVDLDGDLEVIAGGGRGPWIWHHSGQELHHGGDHWTFGLFRNFRQNVSAPSFGDLDGDGKNEVLTVGQGNAKKLYAMGLDAKDHPGWPKDLPAAAQGPASVADLNGDGKANIFLYCPGDGSLLAWKGDGKPLGSKDKIADAGKEGRFSPVLVDLDGNGDLEIVGVNGQGDLYGFHHDGTKIAGLCRAVGQDKDYYSEVTAGDITGDGKPEVLLVGDKGAKVHALGIDGADAPGFPAALSPPAGKGVHRLILADIDGDGKPEVVVAAPNKLYVLRADGKTVPGFPAGFQGRPSGVAAGDIDGDGLIDLVVPVYERRLFAFGADGQPHTGWPVRIQGPVWTPPLLTDLDGDGDIEILVGSDTSRIYVWDLPGPYRPGALEWPASLDGAGRRPVWRPAPAKPSGLAVDGESRPTLSWSAPPHAPGGYYVYRALADGPLVRVTPQPLTGTRFRDEGIEPGGTYRFAVTSVSTRGRESRFCDQMRWNDPRPAALMAKAEKAEIAQKAVKAAGYFREIIEAYPRSDLLDQARKGLGRVRRAAGLEDAADAAERDRYCSATLALGDSWAKYGFRLRASDCYRRAAGRDPYGPWADRAQKRMKKLQEGKD
jgi:hypothetical protein